MITERIRVQANNYLRNLKAKHSKSKGLNISNSMQDYLLTSQLSTNEKQLLFSLRTHTFKCKANYSFKFGANLNCEICNETENQQHLLKCKLTEDIDLTGVKYSDVFGTLTQQIKITKALKQITDIRNSYLVFLPLVEARSISIDASYASILCI